MDKLEALRKIFDLDVFDLFIHVKFEWENQPDEKIYLYQKSYTKNKDIVINCIKMVKQSNESFKIQEISSVSIDVATRFLLFELGFIVQTDVEIIKVGKASELEFQLSKE